jgi:hypothetical protein
MWNKFTRMNSTKNSTPLYTTKTPRSKNTWNFYFSHVYQILYEIIENKKTKKKSTCVGWIPFHFSIMRTRHCVCKWSWKDVPQIKLNMWKKASPYWMVKIEFRWVKFFTYCTKWILYLIMRIWQIMPMAIKERKLRLTHKIATTNVDFYKCNVSYILVALSLLA